MKSLLFFLTLGLLVLPANAKPLKFPNKGDIMFSIDIPKDWEPEKDEDDVIDAYSPDEHIYLSIWELESKEEIKSLAKDIVELLKDHAKKIKMEGEPKEAHPGGMDGVLFKGTAKDKEDGHALDFYALLITNKGRAAVLYIEADAETPKEESAQLELILKSITPPAGKRLLHAALALDKDTRPTNKFTADAPKIYAFYIGDALKAGDIVRGVWIAEDVGSAAPKETKIDESSLTASTPTDASAFSLSKPTNGWPIGSYRMEIYVGDTLAETLKFTISQP